jgi:hypothetical protein
VNFLFSLLSFVFFLLLVSIIARGCVVCVKSAYACPSLLVSVGRLVVVIDVNPSHGFWTARLIKVFGHEGQCTCIYNTHEWIVYIMLFLVVCGTSCGSSWLRRNEFLKMTKALMLKGSDINGINKHHYTLI